MIIQEDEERFLNSADDVEMTLTHGEVETLVGLLGEWLEENYDKRVEKLYDKLVGVIG